MKDLFRLATLLCIVAFTASCQSGSGDPSNEHDETKVSGLRLENMDTTASPREDFFRYVNGTYIDNTEIPASETRWGVFSELRENNEKLLRGILQEAAKNPGERGSTSQKLGTFYLQGMDSASIEKAGYEPLKPFLERIDGISSKEDLATEFGYFHTIGIRPGFSWWAGSDARNSKMNIANMFQGGLGLPDRDYYLDKGEEKENFRKEYVLLIEKMLGMIGYGAEEAKNASLEIMRMETELAEVSLTRVERRDPERTYNKMPLSQLVADAPGFEWVDYFNEVGLKDLDSLNVGMPGFAKAFAEKVQKEDLENWKHYMKWNLVRGFSNQLSSDFVETRFAFYGKTLNGQEVLQPRWKRVGDMVEGRMGELLGQLYVKEAFPRKQKTKPINSSRMLCSSWVRDWLNSNG